MMSSSLALLLVAFLLVVTYSELNVSGSVSLIEGRIANPMFRVRLTGSNSSGFSLATIAPTGLSPSQVRKAYNLPPTGGNGTIAIIDAYDYPTAQSDLDNFSNQFGLPVANFEKHKMHGTNTVNQKLGMKQPWIFNGLMQ